MRTVYHACLPITSTRAVAQSPASEAIASDRQGVFRLKTFVQSFRGSAAGREPGIHSHSSGSMDSGLASASLRRPGMTDVIKVGTSAPAVVTKAGPRRLGPDLGRYLITRTGLPAMKARIFSTMSEK